MQIFLRILKELGLAIIILGLILLVFYLLFQKQIPFLSSDIPNAVVYAGIDPTQFETVGGLENETDPTKYYASTNPQIRNYESEHRIDTGVANPFDKTVHPDTDMPNEKVSIENKASKIYTGEAVEGGILGSTDMGSFSMEVNGYQITANQVGDKTETIIKRPDGTTLTVKMTQEEVQKSIQNGTDTIDATITYPDGKTEQKKMNQKDFNEFMGQ